jgi:hypothetical protein
MMWTETLKRREINLHIFTNLQFKMTSGLRTVENKALRVCYLAQLTTQLDILLDIHWNIVMFSNLIKFRSVTLQMEIRNVS